MPKNYSTEEVINIANRFPTQKARSIIRNALYEIELKTELTTTSSFFIQLSKHISIKQLELISEEEVRKIYKHYLLHTSMK